MKKYALLFILFCFIISSHAFAQTARDSMLLAPATALTLKAPVITNADIQKALAERGYYDGPIDNILSKEVKDALLKFRIEENVPIGSHDNITPLFRALGLLPHPSPR